MKRRATAAFLVVLTFVGMSCGSPVPAGFHEYVVFERLRFPMALAFTPDGRIYVAEKRGTVQLFDNALDDTATQVVDLRTNVMNYWDRGMMDIAIPPNFADNKALYVLYAYDAPPGRTAPVWGMAGGDNDNCPNPPGGTGNGCVVTGRLSRLPLDDAGIWTGEEQVLVHDWCQQYPSHSTGSIVFGRDGALYASGGEGASFTFHDYGQRGDPRNPCGDPPTGFGGVQILPTAEGGSLRAQDVRTSTDPTTLGGTVIRIDPLTGAALPDNPFASSPDPNTRRIVAYGMRNPFRLSFRPGTDELWIGDVGSNILEEVNRTVANDAVVDNFGWPCYEGTPRHPGWDPLDVGLCESLYAERTAKAPFWTYRQNGRIVPDPGRDCDPAPGAAIAGSTFLPASAPYPDDYDGAFFFGEAVRQCIFAIRAGPDGLPDPATVEVFHTSSGTPTDLTAAPNGELWFLDGFGGTVKRIGYASANNPPLAAVRASATSGDPPLTVTFDASGSSDPDPGDSLTYAWDLDNDGEFDDGTGVTFTHTFEEEQLALVRVRARDLAGDSAVAGVDIIVGDPQLPIAVVVEPPGDVAATVGDTVHMWGYALDEDGRLLPPSVLTWRVDLLHCPDACHRHGDVFSAGGLEADFAVPDHEQPASMELSLTVTHNGKTSTTTRTINYVTTDVRFVSEPEGVVLVAGDRAGMTPFVRSLATNGVVTITAPQTVTIGEVDYVFTGWSDGGAFSHDITVPAEPTTLTATYAPAGP